MKCMKRIACGAMVVVFAVLLAGCDSTSQAPKLPQVTRERATHAVLFHDGSTELYTRERQSLNSFLKSIPPGTVSVAQLDADDKNPRAVERARSVRNYLLRSGMDSNAIRLRANRGID